MPERKQIVNQSELYKLAVDVFGDQALAWLQTKHPMLSGQTPEDVAKTTDGARAVENLLFSTKYGGAA